MNAAGLLPGITVRQAAAQFRDGSLDPADLTRACLDRIAATDDTLRALVAVDGDRALAAAEQATAELRAGSDRGPLHGIPVAVKDIVDVSGFPTRCGSRLLENAPPAAHDAAIVAQLRRAGAVILGKTVTQEFAAGVLSPPARNPWDPERTPGGSSGGSAVAVAAGTALLAIGSDTGGSIRIPAAAVGVVGFKPAFGTLAIAGVQPLAPSLDTLGPLARTVDDVAIAYRALAGEAQPEGAATSLAGFRLGVPRAHFWDRLTPAVELAVGQAVEALATLGAEVVEADWDEATPARAAAFVINRAETGTSLWPHINGDPDRLALLNDDLRVRVVGGRLLPVAAYLQALFTRERVRNSMTAYLAEHRLHAVVAPTLPAVAVAVADPMIRHGSGAEGVGVGYTRLTMPYNATGQPVLALPCGFSPEGLPVGIQIAVRPGDESFLFAIGAAYERATGWHHRLPPAAHHTGAANGY